MAINTRIFFKFGGVGGAGGDGAGGENEPAKGGETGGRFPVSTLAKKSVGFAGFVFSFTLTTCYHTRK